VTWLENTKEKAQLSFLWSAFLLDMDKLGAAGTRKSVFIFPIQGSIQFCDYRPYLQH